MSSLRGFEDIPIKYRPIFSPIKNFNHVQSEVLDDVLKTSKFNLSLIEWQRVECYFKLSFRGGHCGFITNWKWKDCDI